MVDGASEIFSPQPGGLNRAGKEAGRRFQKLGMTILADTVCALRDAMATGDLCLTSADKLWMQADHGDNQLSDAD
ncbi:hypothetical protein RvVAR0630_42760 [Agrobacterium vitis]|nr:hypothetical protein RvVAR0630_42760 [Agrobacterium vitis]